MPAQLMSWRPLWLANGSGCLRTSELGSMLCWLDIWIRVAGVGCWSCAMALHAFAQPYQVPIRCALPAAAQVQRQRPTGGFLHLQAGLCTGVAAAGVRRSRVWHPGPAAAAEGQAHSYPRRLARPPPLHLARPNAGWCVRSWAPCCCLVLLPPVLPRAAVTSCCCLVPLQLLQAARGGTC